MMSKSAMPCRVCGGPLGITEGKSEFFCAHCGVTYDDADDAVGDPWDEDDFTSEELDEASTPLDFENENDDGRR